MATAAQIATYTQVCMRKGVTPRDIGNMSNTEASAEMQRAFSLPTTNQIKALKDALQEVIDMGIQVNSKPVKMPTEKWFSTLTDKDVSKWIQDTYSLKNQNLHIAPPSKEQMEQLVEMYLCPDIPWEAIPMTRTEYVDAWNEEGFTEKRHVTIHEDINLAHELVFNTDGTPFMIEHKGKLRQGFRIRTAEEFEEALKTNLKHADAERLLKQYRGAFIRWERERISDRQIKLIQDLETELENVYNPGSAPEQSTTDVPFGDEDVPFAIVTAAPSKKGKRWNPVAYNKTPLATLKQMDRKGANLYIKQLESERDNVMISRFGEGQYVMQFTNRKDFEGMERTYRGEIVVSEWKNNRGYIEFMTDTTLEEVRKAQDHKKWKEDEFTKLNNILFSLQAVAGFQIDEFLGEAAQVFFGNGRNEDGTEMNVSALEHRALELRGKIREVMVKCIKDGDITFYGLMNMIEKSELAQEIFLSIE